MKIFYHNDLDGHCSAAIVYQYYKDRLPNEYPLIEMREMSYSKEFPFNYICRDEVIFLVDYSLQKPGDFGKLLQITSKVVWIDHHITAIEGNSKMSTLAGLRRDGTAACELAWEYYYPTLDVPEVVKLIGDMDVWKLEYANTWPIIEYLSMFDTRPDRYDWSLWLTVNGNRENILDDLSIGRNLLKYRDIRNQKLMSLAYEVMWEGRLCIVCNCAFTGSKVFDSLEDPGKYDLMVAYSYDGTKWTVSLYSSTVHCGELAKKYGGGGHKGAAGFQCKELPF